MSTAAASEQDEAYRMVGLAITLGIEIALTDPALDPEIRAVVRWLGDWLPPAEKELVARYEGIDFGEPASSLLTDTERNDKAMKEHIFRVVGKAIVLRIRHTETDRASDPDIVAVVRRLDEFFSPTQKEFIARHAPIDFDAPGRPLPPFTNYEPPFGP
jgi:hypothetical protein